MMSRFPADNFNMKCRSFLLVILTVASGVVHAQERYEFYNGVRGLGMGGASVATVNDETALILNPAALAKLRDYFITIADPEVAVSAQAEEIAGTNLPKVLNPQDTLALTNANVGRHLHSRAQVFPSFVIPNFGFGLLGKYEVNAETTQTPNQYKYHYTNDWSGVVAGSVRFFDGIIKIGANVRAVNRVTVRRDDIDPASTGLSLKSLAKEGIGVASDVGMLISLPIAYLPTLAAVYRDAGDTRYNYQKGMFMETTERPDTTPASLDVGLSIQPILGKRARSTWTVEYRDALNSDDEKNQMSRFHAGAEMNFADALFLRAGMNQMYWTAGLELSMMNYQFQAASYGEDIGTPTKAREDRRYVVKFAFRF